MSVNAIETAKHLVDDLYNFRDNYFVINELRSNGENNKERDIKNKLRDVLTQLEEIRVDCESRDRALFYLIKGRALNVTNEFDNNSLELLTKCVKLNPLLIQGWNQLGECYWKKDDPKAALNCFECASKHDKTDKISLRNASMVLRQIGDNDEEKRTNLMKSLEKAKDAVKLDMNDGISWYILGNAYLILFFKSSNYDLSVLKASKTAYAKAKRDNIANSQSDFLFNYANLLHYEQSYDEALNCFNGAALISPDWSEPKEREKSLLKYLKDTHNMIDKRGSLKLKRIQTLLNALDKDLKTFASQKRKLINFNELSCGENSDKIVYSKVIGCINSDNALAHTYCIMDSNKDCVSLVIYNLAMNSGLKLGDTIVITDPKLNLVDIHYDHVNYKYNSIRINNPLSLIVNGRTLMNDHIARPQIDNSLKTD